MLFIAKQHVLHRRRYGSYYTRICIWLPCNVYSSQLNSTQVPVELRRRRESCSLSELSQPKRRHQCYQNNSLLHSVYLILFTVLLVRLILGISPHHSSWSSFSPSITHSTFHSRLKPIYSIVFLVPSGLPSRILD